MQQQNYTYEDLQNELKNIKKEVQEFKNDFKFIQGQINIIKQLFLTQYNEEGKQND
jgi:hypothetical protein